MQQSEREKPVRRSIFEDSPEQRAYERLVFFIVIGGLIALAILLDIQHPF